MTRTAWQEAVGPRVPLQQSWAYGVAMQRLGAQLIRAELHQDGRRVALAQVLMRRGRFGGTAVVNRGPVWTGRCDRSAALAALRRALPLGPLRALLLMDEDGARHGVPLLTPVHVAELDLTLSLTELRARMAGKWRNRLRQGERQAMVLEVLADAPEWLLVQEAQQQQARGYRGLPPEFVRAWPGGKQVLIARQGDVPVAAMVFLRHGRQASYQIGWCDGLGRQLGAHPWLLWQAMQVLRGQGVLQLDLGPIATDSAAGLARFKLGAGARVRALGPTCLSVAGPRLRPWRPATPPCGVVTPRL